MNPRVYDPAPPDPGAPPAPLDYSAAVLTAPALVAMDIPKRPALLGEWMHEADIGIIFASRGVGKTWIAFLIGAAIAEGRALGEWSAGERPRRVLYVDGEMSLPDTQERTKVLGISSDRFRLLHHEHLFTILEKTMNVGDKACQTAVNALLSAGDVLFLDNLSALCRGIAENDNDAWEAMLLWFLELRRRKVTVILVHHAGRNGEPRGASRREDAADWVLRLRDDTANDDEREKAIVSSFTKCRGCAPRKAMPLRWTFTLGDGMFAYACKPHSGPDALAALILGGTETASECAQMLDVSKGAVSKWASKLAAEGRIRIVGRKYFPPEEEES